MKLVTSLAGVALHALVCTGSVQAQLEGFEARRAEARELLLEGLEEHGEWLRGKRLFVERERVLGQILALDPENGEALRALGWTKDKTGTWTPPKKPKTFKNYGTGALEEVPERYLDSIAPYLEAMRALLAHAELSKEQRAALVEDFLVASPDDAALRAERGEVKAGERWILAETAASVERRGEIGALAKRALQEVPAPEAAIPTSRETQMGTWSKVLVTPVGRILGTVPDEELAQAARELPASLAFFRAMLAEGASLPQPLTVVLLAGPEQRAPFLARHPTLRPEAIARLEGTSGTWIDEVNDIVYWTEVEEYRRDGVVRLLINRLLEGTHRIGLSHAWAHEGVGLYLTEALVGTRLTWFVPGLDADGGSELRTTLLGSSDWRRVALERAGRGSKLRDVVAKPAAQFTADDLLRSYLFAAFLFEAHSEAVVDVLRGVGVGKDARRVIEQVLGRDLDDLDARLDRWLFETKVQEEALLEVPTRVSSAKEQR